MGKIFGIVLVLVMIWMMVGGLLATALPLGALGKNLMLEQGASAQEESTGVSYSVGKTLNGYESSEILYFNSFDDFSNVQGYKNWYYMYNFEIPMSYGINWWGGITWHDPEGCCAIDHDWMNPGCIELYCAEAEVATRKWVSPASGEAHIYGNAHKTNSGELGNGVIVQIYHNYQILWSRYLADDDSVGYDFDITLHVEKGDAIHFAVDANCTNWYDGTSFSSSIVLNTEHKIVVWTGGDGTDGHFISEWEGWEETVSATLAIHVQVLEGNQPVEGATIFFEDNPRGQTDANGHLRFLLPITAIPPIETGPFTSTVEAQWNGASVESEPTVLYECENLIHETPMTIGWWQALWYNTYQAAKLFASMPSVPGEPAWLTVVRYLALAALEDGYQAEAGDVVTFDTYVFTAPDVAQAWLVRESVERSGQVIFASNCWTEREEKYNTIGTLTDPWLLFSPEAMAITIASPATLFIAVPDGSHAGYDPLTGELILDFPIAVSNPGDEPFQMLIPQPVDGKYMLSVVGTDSGSYTLSVQALDSDGVAGGESSFTRPITDGENHLYEVTLHKTGDITVLPDTNVTGCFIATAAYGTPMAEEIQVLREFRNEYLLTNPLGQAFVDFYYKVSPPIAEFITDHPSLKPIVRAGLVPVVAMSSVVVNAAVTEKIAILALLVLVSVALAVWVIRRRVRGSQCT